MNGYNNLYSGNSYGRDEYTLEDLGITAEAANSSSFGRPKMERLDNVEAKRIYGNIYETEPKRTSRILDNSRDICYIPSKSGQVITLTEAMLSRHALFIGGIGCGKTNSLYFCVRDILRQMTNNDIMIIFDSKGDFYEKFGRNDPNAIVIGSGSLYEYITRFWNIFIELLDENGKLIVNERLRIKVYEITEHLFEQYKSESQPFFSIAASDMVAMVIIAFCREALRTNSSEKLNNKALADFLNSATVKDYDDLFMRPENADCRSARNYYGDPSANLTPQALGVLGNIKMMVKKMFTGPFYGVDKGFGMSALVNAKGKKTVYIEYDLSTGEVLGPMYGLLIDLALKQALGGRSFNRGNVYFIIDEMRLLGAPRHITDALNFGRSQNVKIIAGVQSINQFYDAFGEDAGKVIASGFMNSFCFQSFDIDTRKYISDRFGETYDNYSFEAMKQPCNIQRSGYVVEDWDILDLDVGEAFVNLFGYAPFRFNFAEYK